MSFNTSDQVRGAYAIEHATLAIGGGEIERQCQFASTDVLGIMCEIYGLQKWSSRNLRIIR